MKHARRIHTYCIICVVLSHNNKNDSSVLFRNDTRLVRYLTTAIGVWETVWRLSRTDLNVTFLTALSEHKCQTPKAIIEKYIRYALLKFKMAVFVWKSIRETRQKLQKSKHFVNVLVCVNTYVYNI